MYHSKHLTKLHLRLVFLQNSIKSFIRLRSSYFSIFMTMNMTKRRFRVITRDSSIIFYKIG